MGVCALPPSDAEAIRAYVGAVKDFISLAKEATDAKKRIRGDDSTLTARTEALLQTIQERRQPALVAGVHVGERRIDMLNLLDHCYSLCSAYRYGTERRTQILCLILD
jgi:hypothetical protein